jgi:hypothetical protein
MIINQSFLTECRHDYDSHSIRNISSHIVLINFHSSTLEVSSSPSSPSSWSSSPDPPSSGVCRQFDAGTRYFRNIQDILNLNFHSSTLFAALRLKTTLVASQASLSSDRTGARPGAAAFRASLRTCAAFLLSAIYFLS